jgi:hypothetical protein
VHGERGRAVQLRASRPGVDGDSRRGWWGSLARFLSRDSAPSRAAACRADAPHPAAARPAVTHRESRLRKLGRAGRLAPGIPVAGERSSRRAGMPRIVRVGPSSVKGAPCGRVAKAMGASAHP